MKSQEAKNGKEAEERERAAAGPFWDCPLKPFLLIGGTGEPSVSWCEAIYEADTYEDAERVMIKLVQEGLLGWFRIINIKSYEVV